MNISGLTFDEKGLIPAVVQDSKTKEVLTVAYMNEESLQRTIESGETWFYSRSRQELWHKGGTSGNTQAVTEIKYDCDSDALVVLVNPAGPACHNGTTSCFNQTLYSRDAILEEAEDVSLADYTLVKKIIEDEFGILRKLEALIEDREKNRPEGAYTTYLFEKGVDKILKKVGEEASEVIIAAKNRDPEELKWEAADLLYHLLVLLREQKLPLKEVLSVLEERHVREDNH
ncbi:bifunctional phosphoribosyl-AMP cyclohydrolase/phosphoribosyl-ATP pyrophosphatase [Bacillus sp. FJAT-27225]|uniref:bifunctional phosphoribosyl-AMP cyclohydrolase/phosphoribosyl-ATP diphosphatase HisIE n=1 Tax=Bacillus sp. FJAT-27225 TaxID=1743144 RepID=UPI00080C2694|nr:bifunctional phosphoribosyl-AMP cyclohydrolase/phosphoribosyl-ATP diphosphatase HisIE [Bacillus sp. FJAT-27225]OCA88179.1 bifunctional phosphoribosyl-AMP cyclohydrolase/phosphoribosyl-ATP pyrophosphatase [Bacillus sp. FJAT-27225]